MARDDITPKGAVSACDEVVDFLDTEARMLAYLRAAMLESGDDPKVMRSALRIVEIARARLQRKDPLRVTRGLAEPRRPTVKRSS